MAGESQINGPQVGQGVPGQAPQMDQSNPIYQTWQQYSQIAPPTYPKTPVYQSQPLYQPTTTKPTQAELVKQMVTQRGGKS